MKKNEKLKVGRPKLADSSERNKSIIACLFGLITTIVLAFLASKVILMNVNPNYFVASALNNHINSCIVDGKTIDCGPNVTYLKYGINDYDNEISKTNESIKVNVDSLINLKYCYKTNTEELTCNK